MKLSIVSPVYNAEKNLMDLYKRVVEEAHRVTNDFEIILVEDGGQDESWQIIKELSRKDQRVKGVKLSRNFGQYTAILAGLEVSSGNNVIVMDCDLQDNPKYFVRMMEKRLEGYDVVHTLKNSRKHSFLKNVVARGYYRVYSFFGNTKYYRSEVGNYSLLSRKVVTEFTKVRDRRGHFLLVLQWLGFDSTAINVEHDKRMEGKSSYGLIQLINHTVDGVMFLSDSIIKVMFGLNLLFFALCHGLLFYMMVQNLFFNNFERLTILVVGALVCFSWVLVTLCLIGLYIGKVLEQTKQRPLYLIDEKTNFD